MTSRMQQESKITDIEPRMGSRMQQESKNGNIEPRMSSRIKNFKSFNGSFSLLRFSAAFQIIAHFIVIILHVIT